MQKQILPSEFIDSAIEAYLPKVRVRSQLIYILLLLAVIGALASLPFIKVDISVQAPGAVRTLNEKTELSSLISGRVRSVRAGENQMVYARCRCR